MECLSCGCAVLADGYCEGCGRRDGGRISAEELYALRLTRGWFGFGVLLAAAVGLLVWAAQRADSAPFTDSAGVTSYTAGSKPVPDWLWIAAVAAFVAVTAARSVLTWGSPSTAGRTAVYGAVIVGWLFSAYLAYEAAVRCRSARDHTVMAGKVLDEMQGRLEAARHTAVLRDAIRRGAEPAKAEDPGALPPLLREDRASSQWRVDQNGLAEMARLVGRQRTEVESDRTRAIVFLIACLSALGAVTMLLFLVAAEQSWTQAAGVPPTDLMLRDPIVG